MMTDVVERLHEDFGAQRARTGILEVVRQHHAQLDSVSAESRPELLDRLVRLRLLR